MSFPSFSELVRHVAHALASLFGAWLTQASHALDYLLATVASLLIGFPFLTQSTWYVDSVNGNDANTGATAGTALKTLAELTRRFQARLLAQDTTINLSGTFTNFLSLRCSITQGKTLTVQGTMTQASAGSITAAFVAYAPATNVDAKLTDATQTWATQVDRRIRMTSGAAADSIAWVLKDLGANVARVSQFVLRGIAGNSGKMVTPAQNDTYVVETYNATVYGLDVVVGGGGNVYCKDFQVTGDTANGLPSRFEVCGLDGKAWVPRNCILDGVEFLGAVQCYYWQASLVGCRQRCDLRFYQSTCAVFGHVLKQPTGQALSCYLSSFAGCRILVCATIISQGATGISSGDGGVLFVVFDSAFAAASIGGYDNTTNPIVEVGVVSACYLVVANAYIFGSGNTASSNTKVHNGGVIAYTSKPVVTGTGNDALVGGTAKTWGTIPYLEPANGAQITAYA